MPRRKRGIGADIEIFWSFVDKSMGETACWLWVGKTTPDGYGYTSFDGKTWMTHRLSYHLCTHKIARGKKILHTCDTPPCVQPLHLWPGTQVENVADMDAKERRGTIKGQRVGERHPLAKLTDAQVREIRERYLAGGVMQKDLAREYGVVDSAISHIIRGKRFGGPNISRTPAENASHGERHYEGKLTEAAVRSFRARSAAGERLTDITNSYNATATAPVTKQMIWRILHGKAWTHVQ